MRFTKDQIIKCVNDGVKFVTTTPAEKDYYIKLFFLRYGYFVSTKEKTVLSEEQLKCFAYDFFGNLRHPTEEMLLGEIITLKLPYDDGVIAMKEALNHYGYRVATSETDERPEPVRRT